MPGSFIIRPTSLISGGTPLYDLQNIPAGASAGWAIDLTDLPSNTILKAVNTSGLAANPPINLLECNVFTTIAVPSLSFVQVLRFGLLGASIYLDGSGTPITLSGLPPGFTPASAAVLLGVPNPPNITDQPVSGSSQCFLQQVSGVNGALNSTSFPYSPVPNMTTMINNGIGISANISVTDAGDVGDIVINDLRIEGIYIIAQYGTPSANLQAPPTPIATGSLITINSPITTFPSYNSGVPGSYPGSAPILSSPINPPINLLGVTQVDITYLDSSQVLQTIVVPSSSFIIWTQSILQFPMPPLPASNPPVINIILIGNGTQFSGSVPLGSLITIFFTDGSGVYTLTPGATNDSLYINGTDSTVGTAIPTPYIKTAFVP